MAVRRVVATCAESSVAAISSATEANDTVQETKAVQVHPLMGLELLGIPLEHMLTVAIKLELRLVKVAVVERLSHASASKSIDYASVE